MSRKGVKFPEDEDKIARVVAEIPNREDFEEEDFGLLWHTKDDYQLSRSAAKVTSRDCIRYGFCKTLDDTFCEKNKDILEKLQQWTSASTTRRGLERWSNKDHGELRQTEQFRAVMAVLEAQDEMLSKDGVIDVEKLRKVSHKATKVARHFARMMGKADSYAVAHIDDDPKGDSETVATGQSSGEESGVSLETADFGDDFSLDRVDETAIKTTKTRSPWFRFGGRKRNKKLHAQNTQKVRA